MLAAISRTRLRPSSTVKGMVHVSPFLRPAKFGDHPRAALALQSRALPDEQSDAELLERAEAAIEKRRSRLMAVVREQYLADRDLTLLQSHSREITKAQ
jgi:hypothetical protein